MCRTVAITDPQVVTVSLTAAEEVRTILDRIETAVDFSQYPHIYFFISTSISVGKIGKTSLLST